MSGEIALIPSWLEILGFLAGAACVWLLVRENVWNRPIGIALGAARGS